MNAKAETHVPNSFEVLAAVDCSAYTEKKGNFTYLSWPFAVSELLKRHPTATWRVIETPDGAPYFTTPAGCFVKVAVTVDGTERVQIHPILNANNKTIAQPNAFEVNTSIQRALVKAIALHGLGLYIYAGEDLPAEVQAEREAQAEKDAEDAKQKVAAVAKEWIDTIDSAKCLPDLEKIGAKIAESDLKGEARVKVRAAYATKLHVFNPPKAKAA